MEHKIRELVDGHNQNNAEAQQREVAAICIQRAWRKHSRAHYINSDARWHEAALHARLQVARDAAEGEVKNNSRERWRRVVFLATRLRDDNRAFSDSNEEQIDASRKHLETQHWLELIDR